MKKLIIIAGLSSLAWMIYALFQPIIDWNFGWNKIPTETTNVFFEGIENAEYSDVIVKSKAHLDTIHKKSEAPSISIAAMINGRMAWSYAIGFMDMGEMIPADTSTQYRIGSVSKALTSLGLGKLIEDRHIHPDSSVQYYTDHFKNKPKITIRHLASHQSGIRNYGACLCFPVWEYYRNKEYESIEASLSQFEDDRLLFPPGESFSYSSYNFTALSLAMEKSSGRNFLSYMGEYVFNPLGMSNTEADKRGKVKNRAIPYDIDSENYKEAFTVDLSNKWAGGGFVSTPSDLVKAGNALLDSTLLKRTIIQILTTPQKLNDGTINEQNYALGLRHDFSERYFDGNLKVEVIHHGGMAVGGMALLVVYPEYDLAIALAMNKSGQNGRFELFDYLTPIVELLLEKIRENNA